MTEMNYERKNPTRPVNYRTASSLQGVGKSRSAIIVYSSKMTTERVTV